MSPVKFVVISQKPKFSIMSEKPEQPTGKARQVKAVAALLSALVEQSILTRAEIAEKTGYKGKTIARFCNSLVKAKILRVVRSNDEKDTTIRYISGAHKIFNKL